MKLIIRDYLSSLKERGELDAILPDLLSELGFNVYSRPQRGTSQRGVDIAAVGEDDYGERKVFLFSVKKGDLTRQDWDGTPQGMRSSLNEMRDSYIKNRIPEQYADLKIVICLAFGGDVQEQVRELLTGYIAENTTDRITFDEWNGDKIASLILKGILREELLPKQMRSNFQKAVAMVDEPDVSYQHFSRLVFQLREVAVESPGNRLLVARQLNICLWVLYVWARDIENLEAPYRASELVLLNIWSLVIAGFEKKDEVDKLVIVLNEIVHLHLSIASDLLEEKIIPHVGVLHGVTMAVESHSSIDVNLSLYEILGRIGLAGLWLYWIGQKGDQEQQEAINDSVRKFSNAGLLLIRNNPTLLMPVTDRQGTDVALFLQLCHIAGEHPAEISGWLHEMASRISYTIRTRNQYPICSSEYHELVEHPRDQTEEYFKEVTAGSTLIPLIAAWLQALGNKEAVDLLISTAREELEHCTLQLWTPKLESEDGLYAGDNYHGRAIVGLSLQDGGESLLDTISEACRVDDDFLNLSSVKYGFWPLLLTACHHYRLPIPPGIWIRILVPQSD